MSVRQSLRNAIWNCGLTAIGFKIEDRDEEYIRAVLQSNNFAIFGINSGLISEAEAKEWIDAVDEKENCLSLAAVMVKYDEEKEKDLKTKLFDALTMLGVDVAGTFVDPLRWSKTDLLTDLMPILEE